MDNVMDDTGGIHKCNWHNRWDGAADIAVFLIFNFVDSFYLFFSVYMNVFYVNDFGLFVFLMCF